MPEHSVKDTFRDSRLSALVDYAKFNVDSGLKAVAFSLVTNTAVATWATAQALEGQRHRGLGALMAVFNLVVAGIVSLTIPRVNSEVMKKIDMADESMLRSLSGEERQKWSIPFAPWNSVFAYAGSLFVLFALVWLVFFVIYPCWLSNTPPSGPTSR